jgi:hypothetical protein
VCKFFDPGAKRATVMGYVVMERQVCISFLDQGPRGLLLWDMLSWRDRYVLVFWTRGLRPLDPRFGKKNFSFLIK